MLAWYMLSQVGVVQRRLNLGSHKQYHTQGLYTVSQKTTLM